MKQLYALIFFLFTFASLTFGQFTGKLDVEVSPNPFQKELQLRWDTAPGKSVQVDIMNLLGDKVLSQQFEANQVLTDYHLRNLGSLAPGYYFLRITSGEQLTTLRVVKS